MTSLLQHPAHVSTGADGAEAMRLRYRDRDRTRAFLVLHGGAGPATVDAFSGLLAERTRSRVVTPVHPGFAGTPRPDALASTRDLAAAYLELLDDLDLREVTVIGNSFGGWLAAEIALLGSPRIAGVVLVDAIGIEVDGHPMTSVAGLAPAELRRLTFHDPGAAPHPPADAAASASSAPHPPADATAPAGPGPDAAAPAGPGPDIRALVAYAGTAMCDPTLLQRLGRLDRPAHVIWGAGDGIVDADYGRAYAAAIPGARFTLLERTGHLPQVETPEDLLDAILSVDLARA